MVDNVTKTTFFSKFFKSSLFPENLSLKRLILHELVGVISLYLEQYSDVNKVNNWQQIMSSLEQKIILCSPKNANYGIIYRCAIAFPLSNLLNLSSLVIARKLFLALIERNKVIEQAGLKISVAVVGSGWLDFTIYEYSIIQPELNYNLLSWLNQITTEIAKHCNRKTINYYSKESKKIDSLFPLQYIYGRCFSLLNLAAREELITLSPQIASDLNWLIQKPENIFSLETRGKFSFLLPEEQDLVWHICLMLDLLGSKKTVSLQEGKTLSRQLSSVWLRFVARSSFCKIMSPSERNVAIARLGLIALTQWCIEAICWEKFNLVLQKEI